LDEQRLELLVRLLTRHQAELFRFIFAMHPHEEDARDILQEASVALCRKIEDYDLEQPFLPWALGFAYLEVMKFRERNQRSARLLKRELIEQLMRERQQQEPNFQLRLQALEDCLEKLPSNDQVLIQQRYQAKVAIEEMVAQSGSSRRTLFRNLDRIRRLLFDCINGRLANVDGAT
jgi:RNA polymerase sigma-70 factor, ECF subfamily